MGLKRRNKPEQGPHGLGSAVGQDFTDGLDLLVRHTDDLEVTLYWSRSSGRTWVEAVNSETDERLAIVTAPSRALDVFYDSFEYFFSDAA